MREIRNRDVLRVAAVYAVVAWLILQIGEVTFEPLGLPPWSMRALIIAAIVGFPVALLLAWIIRIEPGGLIFDLPLWKGPSGDRVERKTDLVVVAAMALFMAVGVYSVGVRFFTGTDDQSEQIAQLGPANSIAVLAFENYSADDRDHYLAGGLAEEIINRLASLRELSVAARSSSFQFSGQKYDARNVARLLAVRNILEGSVSREGSRLRVSVQLVDGDNGYTVWNKSYQRELVDILSIQQEIAASVANELKIALSVESERRLQLQPTDNVDAYDLYLQGIERLRSPPDLDTLTAATEMFGRATGLDPKFSRAYAGLCEAHLGLYAIADRPSDFEAAEVACDEAVQHDPALGAEINIALGRLYRNRGWTDRAEERLRAAIAADPGAVDAYIEFGHVYGSEGRTAEAEQMLLRAVDLKRNYWRAQKALGDFYYRTKRYTKAVERSLIVTTLSPESAAAYNSLGAAYWMLEDYDNAAAAYEMSLSLRPTRTAYTNAGLRFYYASQFLQAANMQLKALELAPDDHRLWGRLAESYRFVDNKAAESRDAYVKAAGLAREHLEVNATDWRSIGLLGLYLAHLSQPGEASALVDRAVEMSQYNPEALYYQALARLKVGNASDALDALEQVVAKDAQYRQFIASDPDLKAFADNSRFQRLIAAP